MNRKTKILVGLVAIGLSALPSKRLSAQENVFRLGMQLGVGARAIAMGGAYTSLGGDFSASWWNPATLRDIRRTEVYGSLSHLVRANDTSLLNNTSVFDPTGYNNEENYTKFNDLGVAYSVPTYQGSLVLAFGFNRMKSYDSNFDFRTYNNIDETNQAWRENERGSLNAWTLAGGVDVSPNVSLGAALNFWSGGSDFESIFKDVDIDNIYFEDEISHQNTIDTELSGANLKGGVLFRMGMVRLAGTLSTPVTYKVEENWSSQVDTLYDADAGLDDIGISDRGFWEYKVKSPYTFTGGASIKILNLTVSGDLEYNDWSQVQYKATLDEDDSEVETNLLIKENYRETTRIHLGAEFELPLTGLSFRAGYFNDPSIYADASEDENKEFYSAGVGYLVDKQARLDVTYVRGTWQSPGFGLPGSLDVDQYVEDITVNKVFVSLAFRF